MRRALQLTAVFIAYVLGRSMLSAEPALPHNPVVNGWYADPEISRFGNKYWRFPTTSDAYDRQTSFDAFSSTELVTWIKHPGILDQAGVTWAKRAMWAPCVVE